MYQTDELEQKIQKHDIAINKLSIELENIRRQNDALFAELNVTSNQISAFISNKDHFTDENWATLNKQKQELEEKLKRELANIRNVSKSKKSFSDRSTPQHWLFVR